MSAPGKSELLAVAWARLRAGDQDGAASALTEALVADPGDGRIMIELAEVLTVLGRTAEAVSLLDTVARRCAEAGVHQEARNLFERVLALDGSRVDVRMELALLYRRTGHPAESRTHYRDAARLYDVRGQIAESLDAWCKLLELDPDDVAARVEQAETMARAGLAPKALEGLGHIADHLDGEGRVAELAQVLEGMALIDPTDVGRLKKLAEIRLDERNNPEQALAALQSAFRFDPQDLLTLELLAFAFLSLGENAKASSVRRELRPFYQRGVDADPGYAPADPSGGELWNVDVYLAYGRPVARQTLAVARKLVRKYPFRVEPRIKLHQAFLACESPEGAINELLAAADLATLAGRTADARKALATAWRIAPEHPILEALRVELAIPLGELLATPPFSPSSAPETGSSDPENGDESA